MRDDTYTPEDALDQGEIGPCARCGDPWAVDGRCSECRETQNRRCDGCGDLFPENETSMTVDGRLCKEICS